VEGAADLGGVGVRGPVGTGVRDRGERARHSKDERHEVEALHAASLTAQGKRAI
jgi:hypothetical protein